MSDRLFGDDVAGPTTWSVPELAAQVSRVLAAAFPGDVWVQGQIRNLSRSSNGHVYFDLAEPTPSGQDPKTRISVALLAPERAHVNRQIKAEAAGSIRMADGVEVRIRGRLRWYSPRGTAQLRMNAIDPAFTLGRLQADRERLLAALAAEGLLDANAARPVPLVPLRVGLVTSVGSAAHADVLATLSTSRFSFDVRCVDARTQGADCGPSVVRALTRLIAEEVDVVLVVRGGGARTDLAGFDTDLVARAIARSPVPVFTGIGHEVDRSIADEVAHTAHKTPTAAAGDLVDRVRDFLKCVDECWTATQRAALGAASVADGRLGRRAGRLTRAATRSLDRQGTRVDTTGRRVARHATAVLARAEVSVVDRIGVASGRAQRSLTLAERTIDTVAARVGAHDPHLLLARGWTITTTADGSPVRDLSGLGAGDRLQTRFASGTVVSEVTEVQPTAPPSAAPADQNASGDNDPAQESP